MQDTPWENGSLVGLREVKDRSNSGVVEVLGLRTPILPHPGGGGSGGTTCTPVHPRIPFPTRPRPHCRTRDRSFYPGPEPYRGVDTPLSRLEGPP